MKASTKARSLVAIAAGLLCLRLVTHREPTEPRRIADRRAAVRDVPARAASRNVELVADPAAGDASTPAWALESEQLRVVSPACGYDPRYLSLPERARIPVADQDAARDILEELRVTMEQRFPRPEGADEEVLRAGAIGSIAARWRQQDPAAKRKTLEAMRDPSVRDDLADDLRWLQRRNDDTYKLLEALLATSMSPAEFSELWRDDLAWCEVILSEAPTHGGRGWRS